MWEGVWGVSDDVDVDQSVQAGWASMSQGNTDEAKSFFSVAVNRNDPRGMHGLGILELSTDGGNADEGWRLLQRALADGFTDSGFAIANLALRTPGSAEFAEHHLLEALKLRGQQLQPDPDMNSLWLLGKAWLDQGDTKRGQLWLLLAAELGSIRAIQYFIDESFETGNRDSLHKWLTQAAMLGDSRAMIMLIHMDLEAGEVTDETVNWVREALKVGHPEASKFADALKEQYGVEVRVNGNSVEGHTHDSDAESDVKDNDIGTRADRNDADLWDEIKRHADGGDVEGALRIAAEGHAQGSAVTGPFLALEALAENDLDKAMGFYVDAINRGGEFAHTLAAKGLLDHGHTYLAEQILIILLQSGADLTKHTELSKLLPQLARQLHTKGDTLRGNLWLFLARVVAPHVEAYRATGARATEVGAFAVAGHWLQMAADEGDSESMMWMAHIMGDAGNNEGVMQWVSEAYKHGNEEAISFVNEHNLRTTHPEMFT